MTRALVWLTVAAAMTTITAAAPAIHAQPNARAKAVTKFKIAKARFVRDLDWRALQASLRHVVEADPSYAKPYFHLGLAAAKLEQFAMAARWFAKARALQPTGRMAVQAQLQLDRVQRIIRIDRTAAGRKKRRFDQAMAQARTLLQRGAVGTAYAKAERAARLDRRRWEAPALQALIRVRQEQFGMAATSFRRALRLAPTSAKAALRQALNQCSSEGQYVRLLASGHRELTANRLEAAARQFMAAQRLRPNRAKAGYLAASALTMLKQYQRAVAILVKVRTTSTDPTWAVKAHEMLEKLARMYGVGPRPRALSSSASRTLIKAVQTHPIHDLARQGRLGALQNLLGSGANISRKDARGLQAIHHAAAAGHTQVLHYLLRKQRSLVDVLDDKRRTPLFVALANRRNKAATLLLSAGANVRARDRHGKGPLHFAAQGGSVVMAHKLMAIGVDFRRHDNRYEQPIHTAARFGRVKLMALLLARGVSATTPAVAKHRRSKVGRQPLHFAAKHGQAGAVKFLLRRGASANPRSGARPSPLHEAAKAGHAAVVQLLLRRRASVTAVDGWQKQTALHLAAKHNHYRVVQYLLAAGARVNARTRARKTALDLAKNYRVIQLIRRYNGRHQRELGR